MTTLTIPQLEAREVTLLVEVERVRGQYDDLVARAEREGRSNDPGVLEKIERLRLGYNALAERYNEALQAVNDARHAFLAERAGDPRHTEHGFDGSYGSQPLGTHDDSTPTHVRGSRELGLRAIERMRGTLSAAAGDRLVDLVERDRSGADARYLEAVSRPEYERAFWRRVTRPESAPYEMTPQEGQAMRDVAQAEQERALTVGSGLLPLPATIDPSVNLISDGALNPIRQLATVTTITTSEWHGVNSAGMTAAFSAESTEVADGTPTLVQPIIKAEKAQTYAEFSIEAGLDWASLAEEMTRLISDAKDVLEADRFISGTGTNQPEGLVAGLSAASVITAAGTASFAVADVYKMQNSLPARFSPRARWLSSLTIANLSWQFVAAGSTTAARIWDDARTSLLGKPWSEVSTMSTVLTTGALNLLYGDIAAAYKIVDRIGLSVELVPLVMGSNRRPLGTRGLYAYWRVGAAVLVDNAVRLQSRAEPWTIATLSSWPSWTRWSTASTWPPAATAGGRAASRPRPPTCSGLTTTGAGQRAHSAASRCARTAATGGCSASADRMADDDLDLDAGLDRPLDADDVERMLGEFVDARMSGKRITAFIATAIEMHEDQARVMRMLRCGATIVLRTRGHGRVQAVLVFQADAQLLADLRARLWGEVPSVAPERPHRERSLVLAEVPVSALAAVPRG